MIDPAMHGKEQTARRQVLRTAILWTPFLALFLGASVALLVNALDGTGGAWFGFVITGLMGILVGFVALAAWRDLFAQPVETSGLVSRKWRKNDMIFFRAHYVMVGAGKQVFRVRGDVYHLMPEIGGRVYCYHFPHTNALVDWRQLEAAPERLDAETDEEPEPSAVPEEAAAAETEKPSAWGSEQPVEWTAQQRVEPPRFDAPSDGRPDDG